MAAKSTTHSEPLKLPITFRASPVYTVGLGLFIVASGSLIHRVLGMHNEQVVIMIGLLTGVFVGLWLVSVTSAYRLDVDGLQELSLAGKKRFSWSEIGAVERMIRGYALKTVAGRDLMLFTLLNLADQKAIGEEVVARAGLRLTREKVHHPVVEKWTN
jgi:hypothetical protein